MMSYISNWAVDCESHTGSDHMLIRFNIETDERNTVVDPTTNKYNFKKTNWKKFKEVLKDDNFDRTWQQNEQNKDTLEKIAKSLRDSI